jgi:hypothetical protein
MREGSWRPFNQPNFDLAYPPCAACLPACLVCQAWPATCLGLRQVVRLVCCAALDIGGVGSQV